MNQKEKAKFRTTKEWKEHREELIKENNEKCQCCGRKFPSKRLHCHHMDLDSANYKDLTKEKFKILCSPCHDFLHWAHTLSTSKKNKTTNQDLINLQTPYFL